jgi:hypothetical protein
MPRIRLAFWHDGHAPGDEVDVDDGTLRALRRDGRVAEVLPDKPAFAEGGVLPPGLTAASNSSGEPEAVSPPRRGRKTTAEE